MGMWQDQQQGPNLDLSALSPMQGGVLPGGGSTSGSGMNMGPAIPGMGMGGGGALGFLSGGNTPQDRGFGINSPSEFWGYDTGPGMQNANPTGMESLDMTQPGAAEAFFARNQGKYTAPGQAQGFFDANKQAFTNPGQGESFATKTNEKYFNGGPGTSNRADEWFQQFKGNMPNIDQEPGSGAYYDHAKSRATADVDRAAAARGGFGSTVALDQNREAIGGLEADRAKNEADYNLRRIGEQRAWQGLGGNLASGADASSRSQSDNERSWMGALGELNMQGQNAQQNRIGQGMQAAGALDNFGLNQLSEGMNAANSAQGNQMQRAATLFNTNMGFGSALSDMAGGVYDDMFAADQGLMDASMGMEMGLGAEALNQDYRTQQRIKDDASWAMDMMGGAMTGGLLGG